MVTDISWWAPDGDCYFLVGSGWLLLFPGGLWMVTVISWWALDGCCYFLVGSGWFLLFPGGLWMVAVISWWALDGCCYFLVGSSKEMTFSDTDTAQKNLMSSTSLTCSSPQRCGTRR